MALGWSLSWGLALGLVCFTLVGLRRGLTLRALVRMAWEGARTSLVVLRILVLIGFLTALWRASGTIAFFVHTGLEWMHPGAFYLAAFLLAAALCGALPIRPEDKAVFVLSGGNADPALLARLLA